MTPQFDRDLVFEFVYTFSRFESAMMRAGYAIGTAREAHPDWAAIGRLVASHAPDELGRVLASGQPLLRNPPRKLVRNREGLAWSDTVDGSPSEIERILLFTRRIRASLFHGGNYADGPAPEAAAEPERLRACIEVLREVLQLRLLGQVRENFRYRDRP